MLLYQVQVSGADGKHPLIEASSTAAPVVFAQRPGVLEDLDMNDDEPETQVRKINEGLWLMILGVMGAFFLASRFTAPGHSVSLWGTWEVLAHIWVGFCVGAMVFYRPAYLNNKTDNRFRVGVFAIMMVPSLVELAFAILYPHGR